MNYRPKNYGRRTFRQYVEQVNYTLDRNLTRGVKWLMLINVAVFLVEFFVLIPLRVDDLFIALFAQNPVVQFTESDAGLGIKFNWLCVMQFFTYMFLHASFWHLFWNMLALWFFGPPLEARWGKVVFLKFYLFTGFTAGALHGLVAPFFTTDNYYMIGASGAIFGVLLAFAICYPQQKVLLWFVLPMASRYFVILIGVFTFLSLLGGGGSTISHFTHLAGLAFGYLWIRLGERYPSAWLFDPRVLPFSRSRQRYDRLGGSDE